MKQWYQRTSWMKRVLPSVYDADDLGDVLNNKPNIKFQEHGIPVLTSHLVGYSMIHVHEPLTVEDRSGELVLRGTDYQDNSRFVAVRRPTAETPALSDSKISIEAGDVIPGATFIIDARSKELTLYTAQP